MNNRTAITDMTPEQFDRYLAIVDRINALVHSTEMDYSKAVANVLAVVDSIDLQGQNDDVVDAEIHCSDCNSELRAKIKNHIIERIVHRQTMIDTTLEPITMHPIHRAALYELDLLAKYFHEDADS